ncbi:MAG: polyprenyl synthetase family protein [Deltaproteobacteria bacterium]|nr:polyprenyl synthetase family protein [Deltaproteobacteria bacterium]
MNRFPLDWPPPGAIDLTIHDLPHESSTTEWWYLNGHFVTEGGGQYSIFASFFRKLKRWHQHSKQPEYVYSLTWSIVDVQGKKIVNVSRVDRSAAAEGIRMMDRGLGSKDKLLNQALREILQRGNVPIPDRVFESRVYVAMNKLDLDYGGARFSKLEEGGYRLKLYDSRKQVGCDIVFEPRKAAVRHGDDGVVRGTDDETMFYYFIPRCKLRGKLIYRGMELVLSDGQGWYDHEFGVGEVESIDDEAELVLSAQERAKICRERRRRYDERQVGWDWLSAQLEDGTELTVYPMQYVHTGKSAGNWGIMIDAAGNRSSYSDVKFEAVRLWQSTQTFFEYPVCWRLSVPSAQIQLEVEATFDDQEFVTLISKPSFWEGRVEIRGRIGAREVKGVGFVERCGYAPYETLEGFFQEVGKVVRQSVKQMLPWIVDDERARDLIASKGHEHYLHGVDLEQYARTHIHPIREIVDRGGKSWRSYAAITCCDIVGGDSREFVKWLALPEMMHVGSLIVDDVEDRSDVRRGGPTVHKIWGEAQAINSGTAAYFIGSGLLMSDRLSDAAKLKLYDLYFETLRAGHAGQALDIDGFDHLMPQVVESGDSTLLESRILAVHRLKTAAPAGCLARMGAIAGNGTAQQVEGLGRFFEALGLAFQIVDDVLNIRGFKGNLKNKAEDLVQGKVTLPVAKAMPFLGHADRVWLYQSLRAERKDERLVKLMVDKLEGCGAVDACDSQARQLVERGWEEVQPLLEDSLAKMLLRAFGWFVLERHY